MDEREHRRDQHPGLRRATASQAGYMSPEDKAFLDQLREEAAVVAAEGNYLTQQDLDEHVTTQHPGVQRHSQLQVGDDDHPEYLRADGTRALAAAWAAGQDISASSLSTDAGTTKWTLGDYTAGAPAATGYVTITIGGVTYKLLVST